MLTDADIAAAAPREKPFKMGDSGGLYLYVTPAGAKSWRFKYRTGGQERRLTFGLYPDVGIGDARGQRDRAKALLKAGQDPRVAMSLEAQLTVEAMLTRLPEGSVGASRVYFIRAASGQIKIGVSTDVVGRLAQLQYAHDRPLQLLGSIPGGYAAEGVLHRLFAECATGGEWFNPSPRLLEFIEENAEAAPCR